MKLSNYRDLLPVYVMIIVPVLVLLIYVGLVFANIYTVDVVLAGDVEMTVEYGETFVDPGAEAVYYGSIFLRDHLDIPVVTEGTVDVTRVGEYTICYSAEHDTVHGEATRTVHVVDTQPPKISLVGEATITLPIGAVYQEPGWSAWDNYNGDLTDAVAITGSVDSSVPGVYTLGYSVEDSTGNVDRVKRTVIYEDVTAPELVLAAGPEMEIEFGAVFEDPGVTALDDCDGDVTQRISMEGSVDTAHPGIYLLEYTVSDVSGNTAKIQRTVRVVDRITPELCLNGEDTVTVFVGDNYEDAGCTVSDNCDGDLSQQVQVSSDVDIYVPGTYTVTYTVSDSSGNTAAVSRTVIVCRGIVYLTYDDGPSCYTDRLLDILDAYDAKATFFLVNTGYIELAAREAEEGHAVGIHSVTHEYWDIYESEEAFLNDLYTMQSIIESYTGQKSMIMRFPGGSSNTVSWFNEGIMTRLTKLVEEEGFRYFDWNVGSHDASKVITWEEVARNVIGGIRHQRISVVLMHDSKGTCTKATERILQWGLANGYVFRALTFDGPGCHLKVQN